MAIGTDELRCKNQSVFKRLQQLLISGIKLGESASIEGIVKIDVCPIGKQKVKGLNTGRKILLLIEV